MAHSCPNLGLHGWAGLSCPSSLNVDYSTGLWGDSSFKLPFFASLEEWARLKVMLFPLNDLPPQHSVLTALGPGGSQGEGRANADPSLFSLFSNSGGVIAVTGGVVGHL